MIKTVFVLSIGVVNIQSGKTDHDWSIYDDLAKRDAELFFCGSYFLIGAKGSLKIGDKLVLRNNDTQRKMQETEVTDIFPCDKDIVVEKLLEKGYDYRQLKAFAKKMSKSKLRTSYSIKGITIQDKDQ